MARLSPGRDELGVQRIAVALVPVAPTETVAGPREWRAAARERARAVTGREKVTEAGGGPYVGDVYAYLRARAGGTIGRAPAGAARAYPVTSISGTRVATSRSPWCTSSRVSGAIVVPNAPTEMSCF